MAVGAAPRVASLDYCSDQYVLSLANREQIAALSTDATSEFSYHAEMAAGLPVVAPSPEAVLALDPDVVVRHWGGGLGAGEMLERFGTPVVQISGDGTIDSIRADLRLVGEALGQPSRAETAIADMEQRLSQAAANRPDRPMRALYLTPGGATTGEGTLVHEILSRAGLTNMGAEGGKTGWRILDVEALVLDPPDIIVLGYFDLASLPGRHWDMNRHTVFRKVTAGTPTIVLPSRIITCPIANFVDAVELIQAGIPDRNPRVPALKGQP